MDLATTTITIFLFAIYIEIIPSMGNIWYRYNSENRKQVSLHGLIHFLFSPLTNAFMWRIDMWDINIFIWILVAHILTIVFKIHNPQNNT